MSVVPVSEIVDRAFEERFGVPAINVFNDLTMESVLAGAVQASSPLIVQTSVKTVRSIGPEILASMWKSMTAGISVPVSLHLDHCPDRELLTTCLKLGWNSVHFDASAMPVAENQRQTIEVVREARIYGASVEGEIEAITGVEDGHGSDEISSQHPLQASLDFIEATGVDVFAPSIGNAHGTYLSEPVIDFNRVTEIVTRHPIPIALHGGSGLSPEQFTELIARGCAKVNISTALKETYMKSSLAFLETAAAANKWDPPSLFTSTSADVVDMVLDLTTQFGSAGKAW
ncbi:fructose-bisphosphate aldolase class II [Salinibacterium amurskyense]|uniref:Fructose-bisphosphate aldolase class II n=1 Tax=Salinibacterium amurskyense TaxID=205941 RepID=A0A2M9D6I2_9MICO|nr:class II fructose-bisphosphate aldolase [Salinibacterium amurskyense]PJJ81301.1 fructose-bisphosphate aldolase class II [Salinibacterium amurskyense]RLQ83310.1 class II fructose-bisphosphate aldolase [Salinibacterium amurskyense]GHD80975.1 fructose-bisphosphate aldolase [Salinibacterium amurskyense]